MAITNIPAPDNNTVQSWLKGTRDKKLVYSVKEQKWKIVPATKIVKGDVTYENYQQGEKTYGSESPYTQVDDKGNPITPKPAGQARYEAAINPLKPFIDKFGLYVRTDADGKTYLADKQNIPIYIYYTSDGSLKVDDDYDAVKKAALDDFKKTGQLNSLFDELYKRKLISKETYNTKSETSNDFNAGLQDLIKEYSKSVVALNQPGVDPQNFFEFTKGILGEGRGIDESDLPRREFQDISKEQLNAFIDSIYLETIGRKPTEEQRASKLKELNKIVKTGIVSTKTIKGGEVQFKTKGGFNEKQQALKLQEELKQQNPLEYERRQAFGFMDELTKILGGGL